MRIKPSFLFCTCRQHNERHNDICHEQRAVLRGSQHLHLPSYEQPLSSTSAAPSSLRKRMQIAPVLKKNAMRRVITRASATARNVITGCSTPRDGTACDRRMLSTASARLRAVVFDMDGTLTQEGALDYAKMYTRAGAPAGCKNVLEWLETLDDAARDRAKAAIQEVEREGYNRQLLNPNCEEMLRTLKARDLKLGILTRNTDEGVQTFLDKFGLRSLFDATISRCWTGGACKPAPDALLFLAQQWKIAPEQMMMVGDWKDDIAAGKAAGAFTCLKELGPDAQRHNSHLKADARFAS